MNKAQLLGPADEIKVKVKAKEAVGELVGNSKLEIRGKAESVVGKKAGANLGDIKNSVQKLTK